MMPHQELAIRFRFELLEDMHVGTGVGRLGQIDDTQSRDQEQNPVIQASTLRGLLREAGEDWLLARGLGEDSPEGQMLRKLLGSTAGTLSRPDDKTIYSSEQGRIVVRSLRLAKESSQGNAQPFVQWASTAREIHRRSPLEKTLRFMEHAGAGLGFDGEIRVPPDADTQNAVDVLQLLERILKRVPSIGSGKSRGWGKVRLVLQESKPISSPTSSQLEKKMPAEGRVCLRVLFQNLEPLNLAATGIAGNLIMGQNFLPGTRLRAALLHWLSARNLTLANQLADPESMEVGNAYVLPKSRKSEQGLSQLVLPMPLSIQEPKGGQKQSEKSVSAELPWWAQKSTGSDLLGAEEEKDGIAHPRDAEKDALSEAQYKRIKKDEYLIQSADNNTFWHRVKPKVGVLMRNQVPTQRRDPTQQKVAATRRSMRGDALFSEQVVWEDQHFLSEIWLADSQIAQEFLSGTTALLAGEEKDRSWLRMGRGGRPIRVVDAEWYQPKRFAPRDDSSLTLTLTSDLIARTPWLTFASPLGLEDLLRLVREAGGEQENKLSCEGLELAAATQESITIFGYNSATGLPRAPAVAIKRGSAFLIKAASGAEATLKAWRDALNTLAETGTALGERTAEGFGRFVIDLPVHQQKTWPTGDQLNASTTEKTQDLPWREKVLAQVEKFVKGSLNEGSPSISQWQWIRARAQTANDLKDIRGIFNDLDLHAQRLAARKQWGKLPQLLREAVNQVGKEKERQRYLLDQLVQYLVAKEKMGKSEKESSDE